MRKLFLFMIMGLAIACLSSQTIEETLAQIAATKLELTQNKQLVAQKIEELMASNPLFASQDPFESDFEYLARLSQASPQLERIRKQYLGDVFLRLNKLRSRTYETSNIEVIFGKYEPNSQIWDIMVRHMEFQKEIYELKVNIDRAKAKVINDNKSRLIIKGILTFDLGDRIGLARLLIRDRVTAIDIAYDFNPGQKFTGDMATFSPDGKFLALGTDNLVRVINLETRQEIASFSHGKGVNTVAFSLDGKFLTTGSHDSKARVFNLETRQEIASFSHREGVNSVAFSPDGKFLATGSIDNEARVFNLETRQEIASFSHGQGVNTVAFSLDGKFLATGSPDKIARVFNLETRQGIASFYHSETVNSVAFSPDGKFLATGSSDCKARVFNLETKNEIKSLGFGARATYCPLGNYIACSGSGKTQIFDLDQDKQCCLVDVEGPLAFSPDGRFLAIGAAVFRSFIAMEGVDREKGITQPPHLTAKIALSEPSGNGFLDALEISTLRLSISNSGQGCAKDLIVKLAPAKLLGLNYLNGYIAEIPAGMTIDLDIPIETYIDVLDGTHTLNINFEEANGFPPAPLSLTFSTRAYKRPDIYISEVGIDDSNKNGKIEAGEMIDLTLRFRNRGVGSANAAYTKFYAGENVFITDKHLKTQALGDIAPTASKDLKLEIFINERCSDEIPLYCDVTEATGLAGVSKLRIPVIKTDLVRPITNLIVTGIDDNYSSSEATSLQIDVEMDIPVTNRINKDDFAVIFGVEKYSGEIPRSLYSQRDATWFREYSVKTLGIPEQNIYFRVNEGVTKNEFDKVFGKGGWLDKRVQKKSSVYFYFCGHGIPSMADKSAFLLPYDGDPNYAELTAYPLVSVYLALASMKSSQNIVFLDACFTGISRETQPLYATSRPVFVSPQQSSVLQNVSILSAAEWNQMSNAWPEKQHGLFTYFLLKGLQGNADISNDRKITLDELYNYLESEVPVQAGLLDKEQTPQLNSKNPGNVIVEYK